MHALLIVVALSAGPEPVTSDSAVPSNAAAASRIEVATTVPVETFSSVVAAAAALEPELTTGTLLFSEGDCLAIKTYTGSPYTHVAAVVCGAGGPAVYDSQNGVGVRRLSLADYLTAEGTHELHLARPATAFDAERSAAFRGYLDSQLGRSYGVAHHVTGRRAEGLHCAEYLTDALMAAKLVDAVRPPRVSPQSLRAGLLGYELYESTRVVVVLSPVPERPHGRNWCHELWLDTKDCCANCWVGFSRCVLCR